MLTQVIVNSIIAGSIISLISIGFNLVYRVTKFFNFAHGIVAAIGGYSMLVLTEKMHWNISISLVLAIIISGLAGFSMDKLVFQSLRKKKSSPMVLLVASLGIFTAVQAMLAMFFSSRFQTLVENMNSWKIYSISGAVITELEAIMFFSVIVIAVAVHFAMNKTLLGKSIKAISNDEEVSKIIGLDTDKIIGYVFFLASAIAGLAGIFVIFNTGIDPSVGFTLLLPGVVAAIIGGIGNVNGGIAGSFFLALVQNVGIWQISGEWKDTIAFLVLIIFLFFKPQGLTNKQ